MALIQIINVAFTTLLEHEDFATDSTTIKLAVICFVDKVCDTAGGRRRRGKCYISCCDFTESVVVE